MNTVTLNLAEYNELRDIRTNLEKYKSEADDREQERKFKVKITEVRGWGWTRYETNDECVNNLALELKKAKEKIQELEKVNESLEERLKEEIEYLRKEIYNQEEKNFKLKKKIFLGMF